MVFKLLKILCASYRKYPPNIIGNFDIIVYIFSEVQKPNVLSMLIFFPFDERPL